MLARNETHEFWQRVINSIPDPVFVKDQQHRWIALNDAFCAFMGYEREKLIGKSDFDFFPDEEAREFWSVDEHVFATEEENENEEAFTDASGHTHLIATKKAAFRTPWGEKVLVGVIRDITARKEAQEDLEILNSRLEEMVKERTNELEERAIRLAESKNALRDQRNVLESILNSLADGVLVVDPEGRLLLQNPVVEELIGEPPSKGSFWGWLADRVSGAAKARLKRSAGLDPMDIEEMMFSDESAQNVRWLSLTSRSLTSDEDDGKGMVVVLRDVTARRKSERELRESEQRLFESQRLETVGRLAGGVAHDFNNLLFVIQGCVTVIERGLEPACSNRRELDQISQAVDRAATLTRQLLAFGRRQVVTPRLLDIGLIVHEMEGMLERLTGEHIDVRTHVGEGLPKVLVDRVQMEQVILNLVVNARDAMPSGGVLEVAVEKLRAGTGSGQVVLSVTDDGEGMEEETRLRVFEPFFTTKAGRGGTGLGLPTVYGIVRDAGGYVTVDSRPAAGSIFRVFLPAEASQDRDHVVEESLPEIDLRGTERVLLVEDDESIRGLISRVLGEHGYEVISCRNGEEALEASREHGHRIDLLVTDVIMPGLSGPRVAEMIRKEHRGLQVLFMSGYSDDELARYDAAGRNLDFMQKPFCITSLLREIRLVLDQARARPA